MGGDIISVPATITSVHIFFPRIHEISLPMKVEQIQRKIGPKMYVVVCVCVGWGGGDRADGKI